VIRRFRTIDAHAAGGPLRLIVDGYPAPRGRTMAEKGAWAKARSDAIRRAIVLEPRGHADMCAAALTEPVSPAADAGVLFMHNDGYSPMSGHGLIAVTTIALERGLIHPREGLTVVFDTAAGPVRARARTSTHGKGPGADVRVDAVAFDNVPAFVLAPGVGIQLGGRDLRADVAFGGAFYAIVDVEAVGLAIAPDRMPELRRAAMAIRRAIEKAVAVAHPLDTALTGIQGVVFTGPPEREDAALRHVTVFADAAVDRSPCGTSTCAVMAVLDAMGVMPPGQPFVHEGPLGTTFKGSIAGRTRVGEHDAILPVIEGNAWITGDHAFIVDDEDPLKRGFRL
jgi:proline racemase